MGGKQRLSMDDMVGIVDNEGLGYAIQSYIGADRVPLEMEPHWRAAAEAMDAIQAMIDKQTGDNEDEGDDEAKGGG